MTKKVKHLAIRRAEFHRWMRSVLARMKIRTAVQEDRRTLRRRFRIREDET
jgi:hypothetical protein